MNREEQRIHRAVVQHLRARPAPGLVWFHPPNGGARSPVEAAIFKGLGVRAGVADLILLHEGIFHALELKATGGRLSATQKAFLEEVKLAGGVATWTKGLDEAIDMLQLWGLLRGAMS